MSIRRQNAHSKKRMNVAFMWLFPMLIKQAFVRGVFGRKASKRFLAMRREEARLKSIAMTAAGAVAENFVTECSQRALRGAKRFIRSGHSLLHTF